MIESEKFSFNFEIVDRYYYSPDDPVPCLHNNPRHFIFPGFFISDPAAGDLILPEFPKFTIAAREIARGITDPADFLPFRIEYEDPVTRVLPAEVGPGRMDCADDRTRGFFPEKRAGEMSLCYGVSGKKEILFVRVDRDHPLFPCRRETDPERERPGRFPYPDDLSHGAAALPALLAGERQRRYS